MSILDFLVTASPCVLVLAMFLEILFYLVKFMQQDE